MMDVVLLAAGYGTRLGLQDRPKALADVNGKPFITFIFDKLIEAGFTRAVVCISHMAEKFMEEFPDGYKDLRIMWSIEDEPNGTGRSLKNARYHLNDKFTMVINADTLTDIDLKEYIADFEESNAVCSIVLHQNINAGIYIIKTSFIPGITADEPFFLYEGEFTDIGTPETLEEFCDNH